MHCSPSNFNHMLPPPSKIDYSEGSVFENAKFLCFYTSYNFNSSNKITSDAGSQYRCGRVGRGIQPPSTPKPTPNTQTYAKSIKNARFLTFQLDDPGRTDGPMDRRTNGRTDKVSYRVACPQLKI